MHRGTSSRIRNLIKAQDLSVNALAEATAIPRMTPTRRLADPETLTLAEVERIAGALKVKSLWLLTGKDAA